MIHIENLLVLIIGEGGDEQIVYIQCLFHLRLAQILRLRDDPRDLRLVYAGRLFACGYPHGVGEGQRCHIAVCRIAIVERVADIEKFRAVSVHILEYA